MPEQVAQHGDSDHVVTNPSVDKLDAPDFQGGLISAIDKVRSGEILTPQSRPASPDQRTEETPADSRESNDDYSDMDDDMSDASEVWDEEFEEKAHTLEDDEDEDSDDADADADEDDVDDESASDIEDEEEEEFDDADEDDYADDEETEGEDDEGEIVQKLTAKERAEIKKDPRLRKLAANLESHATRQFMRNKDREREIQAQAARQQEREDQLGTPQGMADYMTSLMEVRPDVGGAAFRQALSGEEQLDVLVAIGLELPKVMEAANERIETLQSDKGAMRNYELEKELKMKRQEVQIRESRLAARETDRQKARLQGVLEREISKARIPKDYHEDVTSAFERTVQKKVKREGGVDFSESDVKALVGKHAREIDRAFKRARRSYAQRKARQDRKATKRKATKNRSRRTSSPPKSQGSKRSTTKKPSRRGRTSGMDFDQVIAQEVMARVPR